MNHGPTPTVFGPARDSLDLSESTVKPCPQGIVENICAIASRSPAVQRTSLLRVKPLEMVAL
jgi:hypothetical protein